VSSPEKIDSIVAAVLSERGYLSVKKEFDILSRWSEIVGEDIAAVSKGDRIENGVLFVAVISSSWRQELSFMKSAILDKIIDKYDCRTINDIVFF
jgi:predicted nucleic acid-binding Zn ribbon protein